MGSGSGLAFPRVVSMTRHELWPRVRTLFELALERPPSEVTSWLRCEAADEPDIQAEVLALLENHERAGVFLAQPVSGPMMDLLANVQEEDALRPGQSIGPYVI